MKTKNNRLVQRGVVLLLVVVMVSCNLDVSTKSNNPILPVTAAGAPQPESLTAIYQQLNALTTDQGDWFGMAEHTTDEMMGPTRGTDWDDFGTWRKLHLHTWDGTHNQVVTAWNNIQNGLFQTTLLAEAATGPTISAGDVAAAQFLRSFWRYMSMDMYGVVQHRPATAAALDLPAVYTRADACDATIAELEGAVANLPSYDGTNRNLATKEAAYFLLAKLYLNKAVYKNDPASPAGPFTFAAADMNKVIQYVDLITANGNFSIATNYWDNFSWKNHANSTENIFVRTIADGGNMRWPTYMGAHYNMVPSGWNGFVVLSDFYNKFDTVNDARANYQLPGYSDVLGRNVGFLTGQQMGPTDATGKHLVGAPITALTDRSGSPLVFTKTASLFYSTESRGYRTNKYPLDPTSLPTTSGGTGDGSSSNNDYVFYRYADALLMKAEAILRGGTATSGDTPASLVNGIRTNRSNGNAALATLATVDLPTLLDERGRELYLEAVRRTDMVRFGTFNLPVVERATASDPTRCLFPIPSLALASNPNLKQNSGY